MKGWYDSGKRQTKQCRPKHNSSYPWWLWLQPSDKVLDEKPTLIAYSMCGSWVAINHSWQPKHLWNTNVATSEPVIQWITSYTATDFSTPVMLLFQFSSSVLSKRFIYSHYCSHFGAIKSIHKSSDLCRGFIVYASGRILSHTESIFE